MESDFGFGKIKGKSGKRYVEGKGANSQEIIANLWVLFGYLVSYDKDGNVASVQIEGKHDKISPINVEEFDNSAIPSIYVEVVDKKAIVSSTRNGKVVPLPIEAEDAILKKFKAQFPDVLI